MVALHQNCNDTTKFILVPIFQKDLNAIIVIIVSQNDVAILNKERYAMVAAKAKKPN